MCVQAAKHQDTLVRIQNPDEYCWRRQGRARLGVFEGHGPPVSCRMCGTLKRNSFVEIATHHARSRLPSTCSNFAEWFKLRSTEWRSFAVGGSARARWRWGARLGNGSRMCGSRGTEWGRFCSCEGNEELCQLAESAATPRPEAGPHARFRACGNLEGAWVRNGRGVEGSRLTSFFICSTTSLWESTRDQTTEFE